MRLLRFAALIIAFSALSSTVASSQSAPAPADVPRLVELMNRLTKLSPLQMQAAISQLSQADRDGLVWVIKTLDANESVSTPRSYSPPPSYNYSPPVTQPRSIYPSGYSYEPSTVITANPYAGVPISKYDPRVNKYSTDGAYNRYTTGGGRIYAEDGTYLGKLNANKYDPESVANPYGQYGSKYSPTSINNPYSQYGSKYSSQSARNPYSTTPPRVIYGDTTRRK